MSAIDKMEIRIKKIEERQRQLEEKIKDAKKRKRALERKADTHLKIVVGANFMAALSDYDLSDMDTLNSICNFLRDQDNRGWIKKWLDKNKENRT